MTTTGLLIGLLMTLPWLNSLPINIYTRLNQEADAANCSGMYIALKKFIIKISNWLK